VNVDAGLSAAEAAERLRRDGPNALTEEKHHPASGVCSVSNLVLLNPALVYQGASLRCGPRRMRSVFGFWGQRLTARSWCGSMRPCLLHDGCFRTTGCDGF
jgi:hypothetical protein